MAIPGAAARQIGSALLALAGAAVLGVAPAISAPTAAAVTALVMGGTDQPRPAELGDYLPEVRHYFLDPETSCKIADCRLQGVDYPAEFWPVPQWGGWEALTYDRSAGAGVVSMETALREQRSAHPDEAVVLFGSSQSATSVTMVKRHLASAPPALRDNLEIVLTGNPHRPNGGLLARFYPLTIPILEFTASGGTPTDVGIPTTDIAFQYDIAADFPRYPLNLFALLNTIIGIDIHGDYLLARNGYTEEEFQAAIQDPENRQTFGDTTYVTIPIRNLPLVQPLRNLGVTLGATAITEPLVALIEPTLRVLVELGYDRDTEYGSPTTFGLFPHIDLGELGADLVAAFDTGLRDARATITAAQSEPPKQPQQPAIRQAAPDSVAPAPDTETEPITKRRGTFAFDRPDRDRRNSEARHTPGESLSDPAADDDTPSETTADTTDTSEPDTASSSEQQSATDSAAQHDDGNHRAHPGVVEKTSPRGPRHASGSGVSPDGTRR
jgi:hypothetical protein